MPDFVPTYEVGNLDRESAPYGYCQCGCGEKTALAKSSQTGIPKGQPYKFVGHHHCRKPIQYLEEDRGFETPCWSWQLKVSKLGYGYKGQALAHRLYYEFLVGPIPPELEIDHLCRNKDCVNPEHLEAVTASVNQRRGAPMEQGHCRNGHVVTEADIYESPQGHRSCRACMKERGMRYRERQGKLVHRYG